MIHQSTQNWAIKNWGNALRFNKKKVNRLVGIATRLEEAKETSLARLFDNWYDTITIYKLLKQPVMTPKCILPKFFNK